MDNAHTRKNRYIRRLADRANVCVFVAKRGKLRAHKSRQRYNAKGSRYQFFIKKIELFELKLRSNIVSPLETVRKMILNERELASAGARICMLKSRCDYLRRRIANPQEAALARAEVERMEKRIGELTELRRSYLQLLQFDQPIDNSSLAMPLDKIPEHLISLRIMCRITQSDLAKHLRTTRQMVSRYERTRFNSVSLKRLIEIDAILRKACYSQSRMNS